MQIKLKTEELKNAVNKVSKGMGNNKMLPITEMVGLNIEGKNLYLITTDGSSKVQVKLEIEGENEPLSFVLNGKSFLQLIQKTTTEFVTLTTDDKKLIIKGNGSYTFSFPSDEDGNLITISSIDLKSETESDVLVKDLQTAFEINKSALASTMETPAYTGFYFDETGSLTTDSLKISFINIKIFDNPMLLTGKFVSLFNLLPLESAKVYQTNSEIVIKSGNVSLYGYKMPDVVEFPINDIKPFLSEELPHKVRLNKQALVNLLDRISVFVTPFDQKSVKIDFTKEGMKVWTLNGVNHELIPYTDSDNLEDSTIKVDIVNFKSLVESNPNSELTIMYGNPSAIKMTFDNVSQILGLVS